MLWRINITTNNNNKNKFTTMKTTSSYTIYGTSLIIISILFLCTQINNVNALEDKPTTLEDVLASSDELSAGEVFGNKTKRSTNCNYCTYDTVASTYGNSYPQKIYYNYDTYHQGSLYDRLRSSSSYTDYESGCSGSPCGTNAICREAAGGRPVCSCPPGYSGSPLTHCHRPECSDHVECHANLACKNGKCVNPCVGSCGINANCEPRNHIAVCSCPRGYVGDPFNQCRLADPEEQCHPSPCGANTKCEIINGVPTCSCLSGFTGNPLSGCRHECEHDSECGPQEMCKEYRCIAACLACGKGASCKTVSNHRAECDCPKGYIGSPYTECKPECYGDVDCPANRPACFYGICKNTCEGACGVNADCHLRGLTPVCSCPRDMTGNPFISCRPFTKEDLCANNPCGVDAICTPGHDNTGQERPVCTCPPGYTGNPLSRCVRGECQRNEECADNKACINYECVNPCIGKCGSGAICEPKNHLAVCKCPPGTNGDALVACRQSRTYPVARYHSLPSVSSSCNVC